MSTHNITISQCKKENRPKSSQICNYGICSKVSKHMFETAVVNEPSVYEPLKFYCNMYCYIFQQDKEKELEEIQAVLEGHSREKLQLLCDCLPQSSPSKDSSGESE